MTNQEKIENLYPDTPFIFADGLDDAIIGIDEASSRVAYSVSKCLEIFEGQGMSYTDAIDYFYFNTIRGAQYMGEMAPMFIDDRI